MSDSTHSKDKTIQILSGTTIVFAQIVFLFSLTYWFGFSATSGVNVIRGFSIFQMFTGIPNQMLGLILVSVLFVAISHVTSYAIARKSVEFIHDPTVKLPTSVMAMSAGEANLNTGERYMTSSEVGYFKHWLAAQNIYRIVSFSTMIVLTGLIVYQWNIGNRHYAINLSPILAVSISIVVATSNTLSFIELPIRNVTTSILLICCIFAGAGASDANNLLRRGESTSFPQVVVAFSNGSITGHLVAQGASETLIMDNLRQFTLIPNIKVNEIRYIQR